MSIFKSEISNEEIQALDLGAFDGEIVVVDNVDKAREAAEYLSKERILGFDTETKPAFKKGVTNKVSLLQLSSKERAYIFQIKKTGLPKEVTQVLENSAIVKAGVAIADDIKILQAISKFTPGGFVELQTMVKDYNINNFSLKKICGIVLGFRISKSQRLTNWAAETLNEKQLSYAATDAWVSVLIFQTLFNSRDNE